MEDRPAWTPEGVRVLDRSNGTAAPATERPNPLRRIEWVPMGDLYPGYEVKVWINPPGMLTMPAGLLKQRDQVAGTLALLKIFCLDHRCSDGQGGYEPWPHPLQDGPMPPTSSNEFWDLLPQDAMQIILMHMGETEKKVAASAARIFAGSTDTSSDGTPQSAAGPNGSAGTTS